MINIEQHKKNGTTLLNISYINKNSHVDYLEIPVPKDEMFEWVVCRENDKEKDLQYRYFLDGSPVKKKPTKNLNKYRVIEFLETLNDETKELIFTNYEPRIFFCDIENGKDPITGEWSKPENPKGEITAISLVDSFNHTVYLLGLKDFKDSEITKMTNDAKDHFKSMPDFTDDIKVKYFKFSNETELLVNFWSKFMSKIYFVTGWNFTGYDWPYLVNRSKILFIDPFELMGAKELYSGTPQHKVVIDYLELYKKFDFKILKENFTLDYTASQVLKGIKKISYSGTLDQLYISDPYKYFLYNAIDSYLLKLINDSLNLIGLYISIGNSTKAELHTLLKTITPVESIITRYYVQDNMIIIPKASFNETDLAYEGGYVFEPIPGLYKWVMAMDFASLYPSVQQQFNISPETFRGIDYERPLKDGEIRLTNGAIFDNSTDSVFRKYLRDFYQKRKSSKKLQLQVDSEMAELGRLIK
jgi:DNA polymerase elongation subunit (family B)